jgi:asparagine synthase (glutamine-hydrolysing)
MAVPLATWLAGPLRPFVRETLARLDPAVVRPAAVRALVEDHVERRRDNRREIWALLVLQLWVESTAAKWAVGDEAPGRAIAPGHGLLAGS